MPILHGGLPSPFVKKVFVFLTEKGIAHEVRPIAPFPKSPELLALSPLGKIPAYQDGDFCVADSSVICAYLERVKPSPALYPADPKAYARALYLEEYSDTKLSEGVGGVFFQRVVRPAFFKQEPDEAAITKALTEVIPPAFDYLETQVASGALGGALSIADIAIGAQLANFGIAGEKIDGARWPKLAAYAERLHARPSFAKAIEQGRMR